MQSINLMWGGGAHDFALPLGELRALQDATNKGPEELLETLVSRTWRIEDVIQVIKFGLCGGGMDRKDAAPLASNTVEERPYLESSLLAKAIMTVALYGPEDDPLGKPKRATSPQENGDSAKSMETGL